MLPGHLEDWLTDEGDKVVFKIAELGCSGLVSRERLLYEVWLFDTEQRNGGVSQYFCNRGLEQWQSLCELTKLSLPTFAPFAAAVNQIVAGSGDPYREVVRLGIDLDARYEEIQAELISELRLATTR
jgi:hypothetical protein